MHTGMHALWPPTTGVLLPTRCPRVLEGGAISNATWRLHAGTASGAGTVGACQCKAEG
jgi:hypothetical protein